MANLLKRYYRFRGLYANSHSDWFLKGKKCANLFWQDWGVSCLFLQSLLVSHTICCVRVQKFIFSPIFLESKFCKHCAPGLMLQKCRRWIKQFPAGFQSSKTQDVFVLRLYILNRNIPVARLFLDWLWIPRESSSRICPIPDDHVLGNPDHKSSLYIKHPRKQSEGRE